MRSLKKNIISTILLCMSSLLNAQSLDYYLKTAAENNPGLKAKYVEFEAAMQLVTQVNALPDPKLSFGYFVTPVETRVGPQQAKFGLSQMFPWFGTLSAKGEMATLLAEAKYQVFLNAKNELYYEVKAAWYPLYVLNETLQLQEENKEILYTFKQLALTGFENGKGSMVDVIRVDIMIENAETDIKLLREEEMPLLAKFNALLNRADTMHVFIPDSLPVHKVEKGYRKDSLLKAHPILEALNLKIKSAEAQETVARKMGLPSFGVGIDYVLVGERIDMNVPGNGKNVVMPMITMSLPVFRGKYNAAVKEAQFTQESIISSKQNVENNLIYSYDLNWFRLDKALRLMDLYSEQIKKTEQAIGLLLATYRNSRKDFEEVLRMQQQLLKYQIAKAIALKDYYTALANLNYLTAKSE
ncbi:MAG: TolC family protein [Bacteroidia bacterium]|nr:TolC family protein [Bacteroidia bacterium]